MIFGGKGQYFCISKIPADDILSLAKTWQMRLANNKKIFIEMPSYFEVHEMFVS